MNEIVDGLVVEDQPAALDWLSDAMRLAFPGITVRRAKTRKEGLAAVESCTPQVAVVDLGLPDGSGLDVIAELNRLDAEATSIVSTVFADEAHIFAALRAGATGYVLKDEPKDDLVQLLHGIVEGRPPLSASIARQLLKHFHDPVPEDVEVDIKLTEREREVLTLLAKGFTVGKVAEFLDIKPNTAAGYVKVIYKKLNISSRAEATLEAARRGLVNHRA